MDLDETLGTTFPIDPESYHQLKVAVRIFSVGGGGKATARVYDTNGVLISDRMAYLPEPGTQVTENKELECCANSPNADPQKAR